eukprot:1195709-Prorocentrum_minimum.AAC.3
MCCKKWKKLILDDYMDEYERFDGVNLSICRDCVQWCIGCEYPFCPTKRLEMLFKSWEVAPYEHHFCPICVLHHQACNECGDDRTPVMKIGRHNNMDESIEQIEFPWLCSACLAPYLDSRGCEALPARKHIKCYDIRSYMVPHASSSAAAAQSAREKERRVVTLGGAVGALEKRTHKPCRGCGEMHKVDGARDVVSSSSDGTVTLALTGLTYRSRGGCGYAPLCQKCLEAEKVRGPRHPHAS